MTGKFRRVSTLAPTAVRLALPDGWDAKYSPPGPSAGAKVKGVWEAWSSAGTRLTAETAEALLAAVWDRESRIVRAAQAANSLDDFGD